MASIKLLGNKRNFTHSIDDENENKNCKIKIELPNINLIGYTIDEINYLNLKELDNSWNQNYNISKK